MTQKNRLKFYKDNIFLQWLLEMPFLSQYDPIHEMQFIKNAWIRIFHATLLISN